MQQTRYGSVIFNKVSKEFCDGEGYYAEELQDAYMYKNQEVAQKEIDNIFDSKDEFEVWNIEIIWRTL